MAYLVDLDQSVDLFPLKTPVYSAHGELFCRSSMGGDLGRGLGDGPPKIWGGGRPMHPSPQYFEKYSVMGCEAKYELTQKRRPGGLFSSEIEVFGQEKGII